jgi:RNA polymerase sigma-70 factor (ECF subfamily)
MGIFSFVIDDSLPENQKHTQLHIDESLFDQIGNNDLEAFEALYHLTERTMYAYILSIVRNHEDALDILHDTYLKILSAAHLYKPMGKPLAWMFTIARNLHRNKMRLQQRTSDEAAIELDNSLNFSYVSAPEDRLVLQAALKILSEEERQIVLLYAVSGMKHKEIARSIGLPLSTALSKYHRALKKLKVYLKEKGGF